MAVIRLFVLIYPNQGDSVKIFTAKKYYLPKYITKTYNVIINRKDFHDQAVGADTKRCQAIRKLTTRQGDDYTTRCMNTSKIIIEQQQLI